MATLPNTYRFFVTPDTIPDSPDDLRDTTTPLLPPFTIDDPDLAHQIGRVLRLRRGDRILLLDGEYHSKYSGYMSYVATITDIQRQTITVQVEAREVVTTEPPVDLHLYLPLMKGDKLEWVLQKATELGASSFTPLVCSRSIAGERISERKLSRWRKIIQEAAEQSCRGRIPPLAEPMSFAEGCAHAMEQAAHVFLLWEGTYSDDTPSVPSLRAALHQLMPQQMITGEGGMFAMMSGPEGGLTPDELTIAQGHGIMPVSLGPRILRAETAPIAATAAFFYRVEQKQEVS